MRKPPPVDSGFGEVSNSRTPSISSFRTSLTGKSSRKVSSTTSSRYGGGGNVKKDLENQIINIDEDNENNSVGGESTSELMEMLQNAVCYLHSLVMIP